MSAVPRLWAINPEIASGRGSAVSPPPLKPQRKGGSQKSRARARHRYDFARTAAARLRYEIPDQKLTAQELLRWLPRLDLTEVKYEKLVDMSIDDSVRMNSHWKISQWLGVVLELMGDPEG